MSRASAQISADVSLSVADYLALEAKSRIRHEYMDGELFSMAGAKRSHSLIASNLTRHLGNKLARRDCEVHQSDLRVRARAAHYVYPDVTVVCGEIQMAEGETDTLLNPLIIIEILSKSTEKRDRGDKAADYFALDSLQEYVLVSQKRMQVEHYVRQAKREWRLTIYTTASEKIYFPALNCRLTLAQIYEKVNLPALELIPRKSRKDAKRRSS